MDKLIKIETTPKRILLFTQLAMLDSDARECLDNICRVATTSFGKLSNEELIILSLNLKKIQQSVGEMLSNLPTTQY